MRPFCPIGGQAVIRIYILYAGIQDNAIHLYWLQCQQTIIIFYAFYKPKLSSLLYYIIRVAALPFPFPETVLRLALKVRLFGGMADLGTPGAFSTIGQNRQQRRPCGTSTPHTQSYQPIHRWTFLHALYRERGSKFLFSCPILKTISPV